MREISNDCVAIDANVLMRLTDLKMNLCKRINQLLKNLMGGIGTLMLLIKGLTNDCIAIDTNVFVHLTNPAMNPCKHINRLLIRLQKKEVALLVDTGGEIRGEYKRHLSNQIKKQGAAQQTLHEAQILKYWLYRASKKKVDVNKSDLLWKAIFSIIPEENEKIDRIFVYVAFAENRILVSNDCKHIINRRAQLKTCYTRVPCVAGADVMPSCEACRLV